MGKDANTFRVNCWLKRMRQSALKASAYFKIWQHQWKPCSRMVIKSSYNYGMQSVSLSVISLHTKICSGPMCRGFTPMSSRGTRPLTVKLARPRSAGRISFISYRLSCLQCLDGGCSLFLLLPGSPILGVDHYSIYLGVDKVHSVWFTWDRSSLLGTVSKFFDIAVCLFFGVWCVYSVPY